MLCSGLSGRDADRIASRLIGEQGAWESAGCSRCCDLALAGRGDCGMSWTPRSLEYRAFCRDTAYHFVPIVAAAGKGQVGSPSAIDRAAPAQRQPRLRQPGLPACRNADGVTAVSLRNARVNPRALGRPSMAA